MQVCLYVVVDDDERFRALANPTRRTMLRLVRDQADSVGRLAAAVGLSQPAASQHLAVLREAGLVTVEARGRHRLYRADSAALEDVRRFFDDYWSTAVDRLAATAERAAVERKAAS